MNAWLKENRDQVPAWIAPVRPQDVMRFATYSDMQFTLAHCFNDLNLAGVKFNAAEVTAVLGRPPRHVWVEPVRHLAASDRQRARPNCRWTHTCRSLASTTGTSSI